MEVSCVVIELKKNSKVRVEEWAKFVMANKDEALQTLENEGVSIENFFFISIESKDYLIGYMRARSMDQAQEVMKHSLSEIDVYHQSFKRDCWVTGKNAQPVLLLDRLRNESDHL